MFIRSIAVDGRRLRKKKHTLAKDSNNTGDGTLNLDKETRDESGDILLSVAEERRGTGGGLGLVDDDGDLVDLVLDLLQGRLEVLLGAGRSEALGGAVDLTGEGIDLGVEGLDDGVGIVGGTTGAGGTVGGKGAGGDLVGKGGDRVALLSNAVVRVVDGAGSGKAEEGSEVKDGGGELHLDGVGWLGFGVVVVR